MSVAPVTTTIHKEDKNLKVGVIFKNNEEGNVYVQSVAKGGIAESSGLAVGDIISEVNGVPVANEESSVVAKALRSAQGDVVIKGERLMPEDESLVVSDEVTEQAPKESAYVDDDEVEVKESGWCGTMFC